LANSLSTIDESLSYLPTG
jgi:hypothetical protein